MIDWWVLLQGDDGFDGLGGHYYWDDGVFFFHLTIGIACVCTESRPCFDV